MTRRGSRAANTLKCLSNAEIEACRELYDRAAGITSMQGLQQLLQQAGQTVTTAEADTMASEVDFKSGQILTFRMFLLLMDVQKAKYMATVPDDTHDAFVSLGGNVDRSGDIDANKLRTAVHDFELTIDIEKLIQEVDTNASGQIDYAEFSYMFEDAAASGIPATSTQSSMGTADDESQSQDWSVPKSAFASQELEKVVSKRARSDSEYSFLALLERFGQLDDAAVQRYLAQLQARLETVKEPIPPAFRSRAFSPVCSSPRNPTDSEREAEQDPATPSRDTGTFQPEPTAPSPLPPPTRPTTTGTSPRSPRVAVEAFKIAPATQKEYRHVKPRIDMAPPDPESGNLSQMRCRPPPAVYLGGVKKPKPRKRHVKRKPAPPDSRLQRISSVFAPQLAAERDLRVRFDLPQLRATRNRSAVASGTSLSLLRSASIADRGSFMANSSFNINNSSFMSDFEPTPPPEAPSSGSKRGRILAPADAHLDASGLMGRWTTCGPV
eukprot:NODE_733_length_1677_cov_118.040645_g723_i0.p1 GENE.NODE_733_length_1677_cov_118.040645_g723_i0~~NODE_733_length_1677_cov_118.040645_g723_i0.p1  ORF type:complete len:496 (-),score=53.02 NODE_733_length_1677_cov_118.040645_g723_i0:113-1600(-)